MKIAICSDIHLEFADLDIKNTENAEVLILAGDILTSEELHDYPATETAINAGTRQKLAQRYRGFLQRCSDAFPHVIYVAGNHEFYNGKWCATIDYLTEECGKYSNIYYLEDQIKVINNVTFVGATLWTDCNNHDALTLYHLSDMMNDFRIIRNDANGYTKLRPAHTVSRHRKSLDYFKHVIDDRKTQNIVVVSHHCPSALSIHERYKHDKLMNGAYFSKLEDFILDRPQINLWVHGHVHSDFDYNLGETRVICHPRGYVGYEVKDGEYFPKIVEV